MVCPRAKGTNAVFHPDLRHPSLRWTMIDRHLIRVSQRLAGISWSTSAQMVFGIHRSGAVFAPPAVCPLVKTAPIAEKRQSCGERFLPALPRTTTGQAKTPSHNQTSDFILHAVNNGPLCYICTMRANMTSMATCLWARLLTSTQARSSIPAWNSTGSHKCSMPAADEKTAQTLIHYELDSTV